MRILMITDIFYPAIGGAGQVVYDSAKDLTGRAHNISVLTRGTKGLNNFENIEGINVYRVTLNNSFLGWLLFFFNIFRFIKRFLKENDIDLIVFNQPLIAFYTYLTIRRVRRLPRALYFHSSWFEEFQVKTYIKDIELNSIANILRIAVFTPIASIMRFMEKFAVLHCDNIVCVSIYSKNKLIDFYNISAEKIHIFPGYVDNEKFKPAQDKSALRDILGLPKDRFILFTARNLVARMGIESLIIAVHNLYKTYNNLYLVIAGQGELKNKLVRLAEKLGISNQVRFIGGVQKDILIQHYQASDLFVLPTRHIEHFGLVTLEALSSGIPVLGTPVGGTVEILEKFNKEFLFRGTGADDIAQGIKLFLDKYKGIDLKDKCRDFVIKEYPPSAIATEKEKLYLRIIDEHKTKHLTKILIINLAGMGDVIMSSPALKALRSQYPKSFISAFILSENKEVLNKCPYVDKLYILESKLSLKSILRNLQTLMELRKSRFGIAINLYRIYSIYGALKMRFLLFAIRPRQTLGKNTDNKGLFYDFRIDDSLKSTRHQVDSMLDVVKSLVAKDQAPVLEVWFSQEAEKRVNSILQKYNISNSDTVVGINPGARKPSHRWPAEYFVKLIPELAKKKNAKIVLTGSKAERELAEQIARSAGCPVIVSCGVLTVEDLTAFIKRCNLFISNDTGPMHVANALKVPLIALSAGGSEIFLPYNKENCIILRKQVHCSPCYKNKCRELYCLREISVKDVLEAAEKFI